MGQPRPADRDDSRAGTGTWPLFVIWITFMVVLLGLYLAIGVLGE